MRHCNLLLEGKKKQVSTEYYVLHLKFSYTVSQICFKKLFYPLHQSIFRQIEYHQIVVPKTPGLFWDVLVSFLFLK